MREFLPQAEAELKFKSLPEDEVAIIQLIEKHEVNQRFKTIAHSQFLIGSLAIRRIGITLTSLQQLFSAKKSMKGISITF
jgi:hypothetical protein